MGRFKWMVVAVVVLVATATYAKGIDMRLIKLRACASTGRCSGGGQVNSTSPAAPSPSAACTFGSATFPCDF